MQYTARHILRHARGAGEADGQTAQAAHRHIGEGFGLDRIAVKSDIFNRADLYAQPLTQAVHDFRIQTPAARYNPALRFLRQEIRRAQNGLHGKSRQSRRAIVEREVLPAGRYEIIPVKRFGRLRIKKRMRHQLRQHIGIDLARGGGFAVFIKFLSGLGEHPVIDQGIAGAGIKSQQAAIRRDIGHIGHAADIQKAAGFVPLRGQGAVIDGRQRRALPARLDVAGSKIIHNLHTR